MDKLDQFKDEMDKVPNNGLIKRVFHQADEMLSVEMHIPAGLAISKHTHSYSHLSILASGRVELDQGGIKRIVEAPACIFIPASVDHTVKAITDTIWFCCHQKDL